MTRPSKLQLRPWFPVLAIGLAALACADDGDGPPTDTAQKPVIETEISPDADFSEFESFDVIDPETAANHEPPKAFSEYKQQIISAAAAELQDKGLTLDPYNPDLLVNPFVSVVQVDDAYSFYDGFWGWYYGYEYLWTVRFEYAEGSLLFDVVDRNDAEDTADDVLVYRGVADGILAEDSEVIKLQIRNATHAIFADWPEPE